MEEQMARQALAKRRAGALAQAVRQGAADLQQSGDDEGVDFAQKAVGFAHELEGFADAPLVRVPDGPIHVAVLYGPGDRVNAQQVVKHLHAVRRAGGIVAAVPLQAAAILDGRVRVYLILLSPAVVEWAGSPEGLRCREACSGRNCITVPLNWHGTSVGGWLGTLQEVPRSGSVVSGDLDDRLASAVQDVRAALEHRGWIAPRPR